MLFFGVNFVISNQSGDHPLEDLAKFGYNLNMKLKLKKNSSIFVATNLKPVQKSGIKKLVINRVIGNWKSQKPRGF
jgi:hypothetical protein